MMNIIKRIQKAIHDYKSHSDEKLFNKARNLYTLYVATNVRYHNSYKHTVFGYDKAILIRDKMFEMLCSVAEMPAGVARRNRLIETIQSFKSILKESAR